MDRHRRRPLGSIARIALLATLGAALAGCASGAPSGPPAVSAHPAASSFEDYAVAFCSAWDALFRAVGNPDTGVGSELSDTLDVAVGGTDGLAAERLAAQIDAELEAGRQWAASAAGWAPAAPMMAEMDRVFVAFKVMTAAKAAKAAEVPDAIEPQVAFEQAGGMDAWTSMLMAAGTMTRPPDVVSEPCPDVPVAP